MTNLFRKRHQKQTGAAVLIITVILLVAALLGMFYASSHSVLQQRTSSNQYANSQAFQASQAGLEYGLVYLTANSATIKASHVSGYINYGPADNNITNISLANSSKYSIVYTNPIQNDYTLLTITSTGTNVDGTSTRVLQEQVSETSSSTLATVNTIGSVTVSGHGGNITGTDDVNAGGAVDPSVISGTGTITANDATLASMTGDQLFMSIFGVSKATMQAQSTVYANAGAVPWGPALTGDVWVNGNVSIAGSTTAGTVASPVTLIINGNYSSSGNSTINGIVYVTGSVTFGSGNGTVNGVLVSEGSINFAGNGGINYNTSIVNTLTSSGTILGQYTLIPGSWKDF